MKLILNYPFILLLLGFTIIVSAQKTQTGQLNNVNSRATDSLELVNFYHQTRGDLWKIQWDFTQPLDTWYGVKLNSFGRVSCIDLDGVPDCRSTKNGGNHLHGKLPDLNMPYLEHLFLSSNKISGPLSNFQNSPYLLTLQLSGNRFEGPLPDLSHLKRLSKIDLEYNQLEGSIPILDLPNLEALYLGQNFLSGNLPDFGNCPKLKQLYLSHNDLGGALPDFYKLKELQQLMLSENFFHGKLPKYYRLPELKVLDVSNNFLEGCFAEKAYSHISRISIAGNQLNDCATKEFAIPTTFSPNGDQINDQFEVEGFAHLLNYGQQVEFIVYNLNRNVIYSDLDFKGLWNGNSHHGQALPDGLYIYILKAGPYILKKTVFIKK